MTATVPTDSIYRKKIVNRPKLTALFLASKDNNDLSFRSSMKNISLSLPPALPVGSKLIYVTICKDSNKDKNYKRYLFARFFISINLMITDNWILTFRMNSGRFGLILHSVTTGWTFDFA